MTQYVYYVELAEDVDAATLHDRIESNNLSPSRPFGGVTLGENYGAVVLENQLPDPSDLEGIAGIATASEVNQIPDRTLSDGSENPDFQPPYSLVPDGTVRLEE